MRNRELLALLKPGAVVCVKWIDSGLESSCRLDDLAKRDVYGKVHEVRGSTLVLAMDVCEGQDDNGGNRWGMIWLPAILSVRVFK